MSTDHVPNLSSVQRPGLQSLPVNVSARNAIQAQLADLKVALDIKGDRDLGPSHLERVPQPCISDALKASILMENDTKYVRRRAPPDCVVQTEHQLGHRRRRLPRGLGQTPRQRDPRSYAARD